MSAVPAASPASQRAFAVLALVAVLASFFFLLGRAPLFDVDEGAFSQATLEMFQRGDYLSTYLNGRPRYDKPILAYWLQAAAVSALGASELAFRLPSAVCASLWALLTFLFARRYFGLQRALLGAALLATSLGVYIIGRAATADALLNLLIAASMFSAWLHLDTGRRSWLYATFAAIGLGFLAKGPVAILVPLVVTFLFCVLRRDLRTWVCAIFDWRGLLLFAVIAVPWYAIIFAKDGQAFFESFFLRHNLGRFSGPLQGHAGSLVYYFPIVLAWTLPFTALLVPVVRRLRTIWRDDLQLYLLLWFVFIFVFFSLSGTKLPHYVLYGITGLVLLMAVYAHEVASRFWALLPAAGFFLVLLLLPWVVKLALPHVPDGYYREALSNADAYFSLGYFVFIGGALLVSVAAMLERRVQLAHKLVGTGLLSVLALSAFVVPVGAGMQQEPIKEAALLCREQNLSPVLWRLNAPSFSVYRGQPTEDRELRPGDVVLTRAQQLAALPGNGYDVLYEKNGIALVRIRP
jgi:4-amino-4-deoxy-L-arabinose transferase-like glycosyltransferase